MKERVETELEIGEAEVWVGHQMWLTAMEFGAAQKSALPP